MSAHKWTPVELFGDASAHYGWCCSCCEGYCPRLDMTPTPGPEMLVKVGETYISDRYVAIRAELVDLTGDSTVMDVPMPKPWTVPDEKPRLSTAGFTTSRVMRLIDLGMTIHDGGGDDKTQHVHYRGDHVGFIMPARKGVTLAEAQLHATLGDREWPDGSAMRDLTKSINEHPRDTIRLILDAGRELREVTR